MMMGFQKSLLSHHPWTSTNVFSSSVFLLLSVFCFSASHSRELQFFHITDLHVDNLYSVDGSLSDRCHVPQNDGTAAAAAPLLGEEDKLGPAGNYSCDPPILLIQM